MNITSEPDVTTALASENDLAELEDVLVARLTRYGVVDARIRRDTTGYRLPKEETAVHDSTEMGIIEKQIDSLAATTRSGASPTTSLQFNDGRWLNFITHITPIDPIVTSDTIPLFTLVALCVILGAIWATQRLIAPYRILEDAIDRIGGDLKSPPLPETGIREYTAAARAVNSMQARLLDYVAEREQLAAALAHDLRTPLTRMKLRMELLDDDALRQSLSRDLNDIEAISRSVIDFATSELAHEKPSGWTSGPCCSRSPTNIRRFRLTRKARTIAMQSACASPSPFSVASPISSTMRWPMAARCDFRFIATAMICCCA